MYTLRILTFLLLCQQVLAQKIQISGTVKETQTQKPLVGANVLVLETGYGTQTDSLGRYKLELRKGEYSVNISMQGYFIKRILKNFQNNQTLDILMDERVNDLEEVTISANGSQQKIEKMQVGVSNLSIKNIRKIPTVLGEVDVIKSLFTLPGVVSVGEGATGFNVRGGAIDQNLVLLDGAPIFNTSHLMGFFSIFNPDALKNLNFYRGGVPAQFGGRTASVLDLKLKDANADQVHINGGIGLISSRLMVEMPVIKDKMSVYLAGRFSYADYLFRFIPNKAIQETKTNFNDFTFKTDYRPTAKDKISLMIFSGYDTFKMAGDSLSGVEINAASSTFQWRTSASSLQLAHSFNQKATLRVAAAASQYDANINNPEGDNAFQIKSSLLAITAKADLGYQSGKHSINAGIDAVQYQNNPTRLDPLGTASSINALHLSQERGLETALYVQDEIKVHKKIGLSLGGRFVRYAKLGGTVYQYKENLSKETQNIIDSTTYDNTTTAASYQAFEPRLLLSFILSNSFSVKMSYNKHHQFLQLISNTTAALPTARWKLSDTHLEPQKAEQVSLGLFKNYKENQWETSLEFFYKKLSNVSDYKDGANLLFERFPETKILQGEGYAYGSELYLKKNVGLLTGWLSYTFSQMQTKFASPYTENTINQGEYFPPNYQRPHVLNILGNYQISKRTSFNGNFTYSSGRPVTLPDYKFKYAGITAPYYLNRNGSLVPDYIRLDLGMTIETKNTKRKYQDNWNISFYNVLNRQNAYSIFVKTKPSLANKYSVNMYKFSVFGAIIPSVSYNFKF